MSKTICILCIKLDTIKCDFIKNIIGYDLYCIVNDLEVDISTIENSYSNITFIRTNS